jgi:hypothetical protein
MRCFLGTLGGLLYGLIMIFLAILLWSNGNGWGTPLISVIGLPMTLLAGTILSTKSLLLKRRIAILVAIPMLFTDYCFLFDMLNGDWDALYRSWLRHPGFALPGFAVIWVLMWIAWQVVIVGTIWRGVVEIRAEAVNERMGASPRTGATDERG